MKKLANILISACLAVTAILAQDSLACSRKGPPPSDQELFHEAHEVFVGKVTSLELARFPRRTCNEEDDGTCDYVKARVAVIEVLKGKNAVSKTVVDNVPSPGNCGLAPMIGLYYVFYSESEYNAVLHPGGSFFLGYDYEEREAEIVKQLKKDRTRPASTH
jgi:hypothetical protein